MSDERWTHTDNDGDTGALVSPDGDVLRLGTSQSGVDLDQDAAERLVTALAEHFRIPQLVICGEPNRDESTVCVRWPDHDGQHAGRGDRSNTHPTWVMWGGGGQKTIPCPVKSRVSEVPCELPLDHGGPHQWRSSLCGKRFTHLGQQETCDVVAGHIGGHQRMGLKTDPQPDPEVSVQDRIQKEHAVDRAHYTMQFNALGDLLRDAFRQRSSLHVGMLAQHTATHEMIDSSLSNQTRLLAEIRDLLRDRLPEPPPPRCGDQAPNTPTTCELATGHDGRHGSGISSWPQECRDTSPYGGADCVLSQGHSGNHSNGLQAWLQA